MTFQVLLHKKAAKELSKVPEEHRQSIIKGIRSLDKNPSTRGKKLKPSAYYSLRVGDYRAIYEMSEAERKVIVLMVGHRKNVYVKFDMLR